MLKRLIGAAALGSALLAAAGCGGGSSSSSSGTTTTAASSGGTLTYCSDISYPPEELVQNGKNVGSDIDIGTEVAKRLGMKVKFQNTGFDGIVAALLSNKCDAIISGMNDTPEREKLIDFVDFFNLSTMLLIRKGNPQKVESLETMCGLTVSTVQGSTQIALVDAASAKCTAAGKPAIAQKVFPDQNAVNLALATGRIDAALADSGVAGYMAKQSGGKFEIVGTPYATAPYGIAIPKNSGTFDKAIQGAIDKLIQNGTYDKILKKWSATQGAITKSEINAAVS